MIFTGVSEGKTQQVGVKSLKLANLNNFSKLWAVKVISSCLVPGPGLIKMKDYSLLSGWTTDRWCGLVSLHVKYMLLLSPLLSLRIVQPQEGQRLPRQVFLVCQNITMLSKQKPYVQYKHKQPSKGICCPHDSVILLPMSWTFQLKYPLSLQPWSLHPRVVCVKFYCDIL